MKSNISVLKLLMLAAFTGVTLHLNAGPLENLCSSNLSAWDLNCWLTLSNEYSQLVTNNNEENQAALTLVNSNYTEDATVESNAAYACYLGESNQLASCANDFISTTNQDLVDWTNQFDTSTNFPTCIAWADINYWLATAYVVDFLSCIGPVQDQYANHCLVSAQATQQTSDGNALCSFIQTIGNLMAAYYKADDLMVYSTIGCYATGSINDQICLLEADCNEHPPNCCVDNCEVDEYWEPDLGASASYWDGVGHANGNADYVCCEDMYKHQHDDDEAYYVGYFPQWTIAAGTENYDLQTNAYTLRACFENAKFISRRGA